MTASAHIWKPTGRTEIIIVRPRGVLALLSQMTAPLSVAF
jgi:hypothetical protein